jgi:shikimate kinase
VVGQRGTGKTKFLARIAKYHIHAECIDLDQYIEKLYRTTVSEVFQNYGELYFRKLEKITFFKLMKKVNKKDKHYYISVGGGFDCSLIPKSVHILWLRRTSEQWGRIFTDRPRLNPEVSAVEEFQMRAKIRAEKFQACAWEEFLLPEGLRKPDKIEKTIILNKIENLNSGLTIFPHIFSSPKIQKFYLEKRINWGLKFFEIRDDLLSKNQYDLIIKKVPKEQILFSLRTGNLSKKELERITNKVQWIDCDHAIIKKYSLKKIAIISYHDRKIGCELRDVLEELQVYENQGFHVKLAVYIESFQELITGHQWFLANPKKRSFLPRSVDGQWQWYRILMQGQMFIDFFREGDGSAFDQPTLYQILQAKGLNKNKFAALIGDPVNHSFTPIEHFFYFSKKKMLVFAIKISEIDFFPAIKILKDLGLIAAAVTSPLKKLAFKLAKERTNEAIEFSAVNTLVVDKVSGHWSGDNTDFQGLEVLLRGVKDSKVAVWGGGGTLVLIQKLLPNAKYFSAQHGILRNTEKKLAPFSPKYLLWAAPRADGKNILFPSEEWCPKKVIDLNYREDSGGREYSLRCGAKYISGEKMFYTQAKYQRFFWQKKMKYLDV